MERRKDNSHTDMMQIKRGTKVLRNWRPLRGPHHTAPSCAAAQIQPWRGGAGRVRGTPTPPPAPTGTWPGSATGASWWTPWATWGSWPSWAAPAGAAPVPPPTPSAPPPTNETRGLCWGWSMQLSGGVGLFSDSQQTPTRSQKWGPRISFQV